MSWSFVKAIENAAHIILPSDDAANNSFKVSKSIWQNTFFAITMYNNTEVASSMPNNTAFH